MDLGAYGTVRPNSDRCYEALSFRWQVRKAVRRCASCIDGLRTRSVRGSAGFWSSEQSRTRRGGSVRSRSVPSPALRRRSANFWRSSEASLDRFSRRAARFEGTRDPRFVAFCRCTTDSVRSRGPQSARYQRSTNPRWRGSVLLHPCSMEQLGMRLKTGATLPRGRSRNCGRACRAGDRQRQNGQKRSARCL